MKLFLDQGLPFGAEALLKSKGFDAVHARSVGMSEAPDEELLEWCRKQGRVAFTLDRDFHQVIALTRASAPSVVRLRLQGLQAAETAALIEQVLSTHREDLEAGAMITVRGRSIGVHRLPV